MSDSLDLKKIKIKYHDIYGNHGETGADKFIFRPSVYGLLIKDNKIFLSKQWDGYDFPGGGVDIHETIEDALKREFFEETGLKIKPLNLLHCESSFFNPAHSKEEKNEYLNCQLIYYTVKKTAGKASIANLDEDEKEYADMPEWVPLDDIEKIKFYNSVDSIKIIKKALK